MVRDGQRRETLFRVDPRLQQRTSSTIVSLVESQKQRDGGEYAQTCILASRVCSQTESRLRLLFRPNDPAPASLCIASEPVS